MKRQKRILFVLEIYLTFYWWVLKDFLVDYCGQIWRFSNRNLLVGPFSGLWSSNGMTGLMDIHIIMFSPRNLYTSDKFCHHLRLSAHFHTQNLVPNFFNSRFLHTFPSTALLDNISSQPQSLISRIFHLNDW